MYPKIVAIGLRMDPVFVATNNSKGNLLFICLRQILPVMGPDHNRLLQKDYTSISFYKQENRLLKRRISGSLR